MSVWWVVFAGLIGASSVAFWRMRLRVVTQRAGEVRCHADRLYHSVMIAAGGQCCATVRTLTGVRFLSREAPLLPLAGCDAGECRCRYVHFVDRRDDDRRNPYGSCRAAAGWASGHRERRLVGERRRATGIASRASFGTQ